MIRLITRADWDRRYWFERPLTLPRLVLAPLVAVIVFLALYPQLALHRSEGSVKQAVAPSVLAAGHARAESGLALK